MLAQVADIFGNMEEIQDYLNSNGGQATVRVQLLQDGWVVSDLEDQACMDFAVDDGAMAWRLPGTDERAHGVYALHIDDNDSDFLNIWFERADDGSGVRVLLGPIWTPEQRAQLAWWAAERDRWAAQLRAELLQKCADIKHDEALHSTPHEDDHTFIVAGVDRALPHDGTNPGMSLVTCGALCVAADGSLFEFVALAPNDDGSMGEEFSKRARMAAQAGRNWVELFDYIVQSGNGYTSDYSIPEPIRAPNIYRAGYKWLRKNCCQLAPNLCV